MPVPACTDQMRPRGQGLGDGAAHLLLLGPVFAPRHLRRDLFEPVDAVVAGLAGLLRRPPRRTVDVEVLGLGVVPALLHAPIMPAGGAPRRDPLPAPRSRRAARCSPLAALE